MPQLPDYNGVVRFKATNRSSNQTKGRVKMKETKSKSFEVIFKELELESRKELLQFTEDIKTVVSQVESQEEELEKVSAASIDNTQMYFSTGT